MNRLVELNSFLDMEGRLTTLESVITPYFTVERVFWIYNVPFQSVRANHACMNAFLVLIAINGSLEIYTENHNEKKNYTLNNKETALVVEPGTWIRAYDFSKDGVLMCFSDKKYEDCIYIDNYDEFLIINNQ